MATYQELRAASLAREIEYDAAGRVRRASDTYWQSVSDAASERWQPDKHDAAYAPHPSDVPEHWIPAPEQPEQAMEDNPVTDSP